MNNLNRAKELSERFSKIKSFYDYSEYLIVKDMSKKLKEKVEKGCGARHKPWHDNNLTYGIELAICGYYYNEYNRLNNIGKYCKDCKETLNILNEILGNKQK